MNAFFLIPLVWLAVQEPKQEPKQEPFIFDTSSWTNTLSVGSSTFEIIGFTTDTKWKWSFECDVTSWEKAEASNCVVRTIWEPIVTKTNGEWIIKFK